MFTVRVLTGGNFRYTYGKGVAGTVKLRAAYPWIYYGPRGDKQGPVEKTTTLDDNGEVRRTEIFIFMTENKK